MRELLEGFPVVVEFPVAWGEMDAQRHVNNVTYFRYMENARIAYYERVGVLQMMEDLRVGTVLASTQCRYKAPLVYPDTVLVGARVTKVGLDRFTMVYRIISRRSGRVAAEGEGVLVTYDYRENRKTPMPERLRASIAALEGAAPGPAAF